MEAYGVLDLPRGLRRCVRLLGSAQSIYVENALDEEYLIDGGNTGGEFGIPTFIRGVLRMAAPECGQVLA